MTAFERFVAEKANKFKIPGGRLMLRDGETVAAPDEVHMDKHCRNRLLYLKAKYGVNNLEVEGVAKPVEETLQRLVEQREREQAEGWKLARAAVEHGDTIKILALEIKL